MIAKYFYDRLVGYDKEAMETGKFYYGYSNGMVDVHHKNNDDEYFIIWGSKGVTKYCRDKSTLSYNIVDKNLILEDLEGDDFELFSLVQVVKCGYMVFENTKSETDIKKIISYMHDYIDSFGNSEDEKIPFLVGGSGWENGMTDSFSFCSKSGIEIHLKTVKRLCNENMDRKYYGAKCFPFIKDKKNTECIYVKFITNIERETTKNIIKRSNQALKELMDYLPNYVKLKYIDCHMNKFIYH